MDSGKKHHEGDKAAAAEEVISSDPQDVKGYVDDKEEFVRNFPEKKIKKCVRKVDIRLTPMLLTLYIMAYLDRANIGNAKIEGMENDLGMSGSDYNIATSMFFVPYVLFELPSNYILRRYFSLRPSLWIGGIATAWGVIMTLTGVVSNFGGLVATRVFLGVSESGFFPGAILLCSYWYVKRELATRIAIFYLASSTSGALSGLLAFGLAKMDGLAGLEGWRWIFIIEGIASVVVAFLTFFLLPDSPERSSSWLDEDEIKYLRYRMSIQDGGQGVSDRSEFSWPVFKSIFVDWKLYAAVLVFWSNSAPTYGLKFTLPQIIKNMGYVSSDAQLLSMPPYFLGGFAGLLASWLSDRYQWRYPQLMTAMTIEVIGFAVLFGHAADIQNNIAVCYFAVCLCQVGLYPNNPGISSWTSNNLAGPDRRSLGIGYYLSLGNAGGIVGSFIFKNSESPKYPTGFGTSFALAALGIVSATVMEYVLWKINQARAKVSREEVMQKYTEAELEELGDRSPLFRYTL